MPLDRKKNSQLLNWQQWKGLSVWGGYFLLKLILVMNEKLNFHVWENLLFAIILLLPIAQKKLKRIFNIIAFFIAIALFWYDSWLPGPASVFAHFSSLTDFSFEYIVSWLAKIVNWFQVLIIVILFYVWSILSISKRLSITMTIVVFLGFFFYLISDYLPKNILNTLSLGKNTQDQMVVENNATNFSEILQNFYTQESNKQIIFPKVLPENSQPFEILIISICSLSWADLETVGLKNHSFWNNFDVMFDQFNSGTSYSGPAALRLMHASCGQLPHDKLYSNDYAQCNLFSNLNNLGFSKEMMLDHNGQFDGGVLDTLKKYANMNPNMLSQTGLPVALQAFDGSPIYDDNSLFNKWLNRPHTDRSITYANLLPLHDGNHYLGSNDQADYRDRTLTLFSALNNLINNLEKQHRKVVIVVVPEHGANLKGSNIQMTGLRDIPSYDITHVPVAIRFTGLAGKHPEKTINIEQPSSYNVLSEIIYRVVDGKIFNGNNINWQLLVQDLPQTMPISENENSKVVTINQRSFFSTNNLQWVLYK
ncbi:cellulose biosynthesis protein BcsG [Acinetobacter qingfengensis]|uniref:Uncharacterized protein n=1 Tax=Acinetobacter qingfengensis TaxID=1262585 RepID=A0A1E7R8R6_9GAMM|nr:cellulose biosynthesis protein BcsG [Acinetobacter qingfengensis]KAA8735414.1 cellulose biosynthesis protein BcsG [Acinetobacter qingfengensis]OEY95770.1 hypothetical protein BJI46_12670 [Acinetobacter qingfengensis]